MNMKRIKKIAIVMVVLMVFSIVFPSNVVAQDFSGDLEQIDSSRSEKTTSEATDNMDDEQSKSDEQVDTEKKESDVLSSQSDDGIPSMVKDNQVPLEEIQSVSEESKLDYIYVNHSLVEEGEEQTIVVSWGDGTENITNMELVLENQNHDLVVLRSQRNEDALFLFEKVLDKGIYHVLQLKVNMNNQDITYDAQKLDVNAYFGVGEEYTGDDKSEYVEMESIESEEESEAEASAVAIDGANIESSQTAIDNVLNPTTYSLARTATARTNSNVVIVLDPGHDSGHTGARGNGVQEEVATLKIAQYCKAELEKYAGVTVYMTRESATCPFPETIGQNKGNILDIQKRVEAAATKGANAFISIHLNSGSSAAKGAEVYYPTSNGAGEFIANNVLSQLVSLGLYNRGIKADSSYAVVNSAIAHGFPGLIIEHAFLSNASDAANYLSTESGLQSLGIADATGIANAYGLTKGSPTLSVAGRNDFNGTFTLKAEHVVSSGNQTPMVCVWSEKDGMDDAKWYALERNSQGEYSVEIDNADHNSDYGVYYAHMYYKMSDNTYSAFLGGVDLELFKSSAKIETDVQQNNRTIKATITNPADDIQKVRAAIWKDNGSITWIDLTGNDTKDNQKEWKKVVNQSEYEYGMYNVHIYSTLENGTQVYVGATSFEVQRPTATIGEVAINSTEGLFSTSVLNLSAPRGVKQINAYVWSEENQSNMYVYTGVKKNDIYEIQGTIKNHNYEQGTYNVHIYLTDEKGYQVYLGASTFEMKTEGVEVSANTNWDSKKVELSVKNIGLYNLASKMEFAVWNANGGTINWIPGTKEDNNSFDTILDSQQLKGYGDYNVHVYATYPNGRKVFVGACNFNMPPVKATVSLENVNSEEGKYSVTIKDITSMNGIKEIRVGTWCTADSGSMSWYQTAYDTSKTKYNISVDVKNYGYLTGDYISHVYVVDVNDTIQFVGGIETSLRPSEAKVSADYSESAFKAQINITDLNLYAGVANVRIAVWSAEGNGSDMTWYQAGSKAENYAWSGTVDLSNHRRYGLYNVHVYAKQGDGKDIFVGATNFEIDKPSGDVGVTVDEVNGVLISAENIKSSFGTTGVEAAIWKNDDQSDLKWYGLSIDNENKGYGISVVLPRGEYKIHVYLTDRYSNKTFLRALTCNVEDKDLKNIVISSEFVDTNAKVQLTGEYIPVMYKEVRFAVWNNTIGGSDMKWYTANQLEANKWQKEIDLKDHMGYGEYNIHCYGTTLDGELVFLGATNIGLEQPHATIKLENPTTFNAEVVVSGLSALKGVSRIQVPVWSTENQSNIYWYEATKYEDGTYRATISVSNHQNLTGNYNVHVYLCDGRNDMIYLGGSDIALVGQYYSIMGNAQATTAQMADCYKAVTQSIGKEYPAVELAAGGTATIESFCETLYQEAVAEGIAPEVVFAQSMVETGWLQFGNQVSVGQFNFAGIGALTGGGEGATFPDVRTGIRAQVQHLKAYASKDELNNVCVDPRFSLVKRGTAPCVEWLGVQENPNHVGWATGAGYGSKIINVINRIKQY